MRFCSKELLLETVRHSYSIVKGKLPQLITYLFYVYKINYNTLILIF